MKFLTYNIRSARFKFFSRSWTNSSFSVVLKKAGFTTWTYSIYIYIYGNHFVCIEFKIDFFHLQIYYRYNPKTPVIPIRRIKRNFLKQMSLVFLDRETIF